MGPLAPHEVFPGRSYVVAYHHGPTFTAAVAGLMLIEGVVSPAPVPGALLRSTGILRVAHAWEYREGFDLVWIGDSWDYRPSAPPSPPVSEFSSAGAESPDLLKPRRGGRRR